MMNMWKVRELMDKATNVVMNYTETEAKVREATNDDAWGPTGAMMQELAQATFTYEQFPEVMSMLWKRMLQENKRNWRRTYKSLLLLNYLVRNGSERVVTSSREHIYDLRSLENYTFIDEFGKDQGINIRHKVRELIDFIQDDDKLREERKKAKKNKDKYVGLSSEAMGMRFGGGERWMDSPKWNKSSVEAYNDWDKDSRGKGFEDMNNSDDGEREDSDNDTSPKKSGREYRDTMDNIHQIGKSTQISIPSTTSSPVRTTRPIKKVDLGAAANYGKEQSSNSISTQQSNNLSSPINQQKTKNDILNEIFESQSDNSGRLDDDDFNPRANTQSYIQPQNTNLDFGDFTSAFNNSLTNVKSKDSNNDEFADFTSAFNNTVTISNPPSQPQSQIGLIGVTILGVNSSTTNNANTIYANTQTAFIGSDVAMQNSKMSNDLFDSLSPQTLNNQTMNNNTVSLNTDLLSDLDSLNAPAMRLTDGRISNPSNSNIFMGISNVPSNTINYSAYKNEENITAVESIAVALLEVLCAVRRIKSRSNLEKIRASLANYVTLLPGTITPQKYMGVDDGAEVDVTTYGRILERTIDIFDRNWPLERDDCLDPLIIKLMVVDGATLPMLSESLRRLTIALSRSEDERKTCAISTILQDLLKSDAIFSAIVNTCRVQRVHCLSLEVELDQAWQSTMQILVSLPSRVANKMRLDTPKLYTPQVYVRLLYFHVCRAMHFVNDSWYTCDIKPKINILSSLISKILITSKPTYDATCLIDVFKEWCYENIKNEKRLVRSVLRELDSTAVEHMATLFLKHSEPKYGVRPVFGDLLTTPHWKYVLTTKIPFMRHYKDESLMFNLISYLSSCEDQDALPELMMKLINVWADSSIMNHTPVEQHEYISRLVILSVRVCKNRLKQSMKEQCRQLLLVGVSVHLESTDIYVRAMGMITAEICTNCLSENDMSQLAFDYEGMPARMQQLVESLKHLHAPTVCELSDGLTSNVDDVDTAVDKKIRKLVADILPSLQTESNGETEDHPNSSTNVTKEEKSNDLEVTSNVQDNTQDSSQGDEDDESEVDSDDDLVPYDMNEEQDKPVSKWRPMYLRDLRDNLTDERTFSNPDVFSESMSVCEELIRTQLPNDDASFAVELLELLVTLRQQSYMENFEDIVFRCCVEIVVVRPKECAKFLCMQFYEDAGKYSLSHRLLFLDVLSESAKRLSQIKLEDTTKSNTENTKLVKRKKSISSPVSVFIDMTKARKTQELYYEDVEDLRRLPNSQGTDWREIIEKRIESHTRRFAHQSKIPKASVNRFANVASSFLYPLLYGFGRPQESGKLQGLKIYADQENILLLRYLKTLSVMMRAAENCPLALKVAKEILELTWTLRNHNEAAARFAVVECVVSVLVSLPKDGIGELLDMLLEIREWLLLTQNVIYGEHDAKCRELNAAVMRYVDAIIGSVLS
ncbi:telomere length regulation protein TEL2 homolog isoform X1 [Harpegnathos saltator]|uniref:telomere length regulation protein TEL2 homolog isoform X1 n=1 Tax=Harpegnathos saltator TaxID=610380 RepID=UPI00058D228D|nr:telomere length regulation protein TEL2 homolog isoform X1 [Harpegnathos saltator]